MALKAAASLGIVIGGTYHAWRAFTDRQARRTPEAAESEEEDEVCLALSQELLSP